MLCPAFNEREWCFRAEQDNIECFHQHVPVLRMSVEQANEVLRGLIGHFDGWDSLRILESRLSSRPGEPSVSPFTYRTTHPENGVLRCCVAAEGETIAWSDTVIVRDAFRRSR